MNIIISAKNFKLTDGIKTAIHERLEKFEKLVSLDEPTRVVLEAKKYGQKIEVTLPINNRFVKAESIDDNLYVAMDLVVEKLKRQIDKYSNKIYDKDALFTHFYENEENDEVDDTPQNIVRRKYVSLKPMSEEEAILQMELLGHKAFMFFNADENTVCLLYKRNDGDYGIIVRED